MSDKINFAWIHMTDLKFFMQLGANPYEQKIGQNITIDLSIEIPFENTRDNLENTVDYGAVFSYLKAEIEKLNSVSLLEYLCEQLLLKIGDEFKKIQSAKIKIKKGYVPLSHFSGNAHIEASMFFDRTKM
jgi:dihydroneopterin aldolase